MASSQQTIIALVGPTATGKSALAEALAQKLDGEIVSADSMQVYRGMDIGTAKLPVEERTVPYHCLDLVNPGEEFNAFQYQRAARSAIDDILSRGKQPILCGGTGLYIRAATEVFVEQENGVLNGEDGGEDTGVARRRNEAPVSDTALGHEHPSVDEEAVAAACNAKGKAAAGRRERLNAEAEELGAERFHAKLAALDPKSAALIHPNNVRRVVRAFEWLEEGGSYAEQAVRFDEHNEHYPTVFIGLDMPREFLYERIHVRVELMIEQGLLDEVKHLLAEGYEEALTAKQAIGYKELVPVLSGEVELNDALGQIQQATRHYAKRQKTWFRRDERITWIDARLPLEKQLAEALDVYTKKKNAIGLADNNEVFEQEHIIKEFDPLAEQQTQGSEC